MGSNLPLDLLANIFFFLSLDSLARARSVYKSWHTCSKHCPLAPTTTSSWFLAFPICNHRPCWYVHNSILQKWHQLTWCAYG
uniref:F-box domain-containing protein n=1 Tax=Cajanus cajan TaxID=3821 RepID=A0A151SGQ6_CAJCA|nr:hypothetical protein KK1_000190 [Cajanus cajan]